MLSREHVLLVWLWLPRNRGNVVFLSMCVAYKYLEKKMLKVKQNNLKLIKKMLVFVKILQLANKKH